MSNNDDLRRRAKQCVLVMCLLPGSFLVLAVVAWLFWPQVTPAACFGAIWGLAFTGIQSYRMLGR